MNLDQTPLKYVPVMNFALTKRNSTAVPIIGSFDKKKVSLALSNNFFQSSSYMEKKSSKAPEI